MVEAVTSDVLPTLPKERAPSDPSEQSASAATPESAQPKAPEKRKGEPGAFDNKTLDKIAARLVTPDSRLAISQDDFIRRFIYKFVNVDNGDVIRQYPHERVVETLHAMEKARERFVDQRA
jgi:uncharacterized FlaG/YvyC family protein